MPWVITRLCIDCLDTSCTGACPVDCIYEYLGKASETFPNQLYIHPDECISCGECEPKCPWQAIYREDYVPELFRDDIALNAQTAEIPAQFKIKRLVRKPTPAFEQIVLNHRKWRQRAS
jgi:ferredoxin